uniref:Putative LOV domain-containing protein n=2 Tax=Verbascum TaxID=39257 RepID=A0A126X1K1_9LAMI|nr:putative LOV domain-containing protein [Verbascum arcturus]AML79395.1 putative LOV domain-containing protein [Verbascum sp. BC-2016]
MEQIENSFDSRYSIWVREALNELPDCFTITDPCVFGHPIVFASKGFLKMVGYSRNEVIGKNGRIFQGPETDRRSVMEIREAIRGERDIQISLVNYRKDGTPFWMLFQMCPVFCKDDGRLINFVGVQVPISRKSKNELSLCEAGVRESVFRCCRREVCSNSVDFGRDSETVSSDDDRELEINEPCEAREIEKTKATAAISNILSVLTHYSEFTGKLVCRKRCHLAGNIHLSTSLNISLGRIKQSFVLTDALSPDTPIVYASEAFLKLTGYDRHEVLGQNCRFLSGVDTDPTTQFQIKECIRTLQPCTVRILNYRKDRTSFWNFLHISPVRNASGKVTYFVGIQTDDHCKNRETHDLSPEMRQLSVVGAVKVAVRSSSIGAASTS